MTKIDFSHVEFLQVAKCNVIKKADYKFLGFAKPSLKKAELKCLDGGSYKLFGEFEDGTILCEPNPQKKGQTFRGLFVGDINLSESEVEKYNLTDIATESEDEENPMRIESSFTIDERAKAEGDKIDVNPERVLIAYYKVDKTQRMKAVLLPE